MESTTQPSIVNASASLTPPAAYLNIRPRRSLLRGAVYFLQRNHLALVGLLLVLFWVVITVAAPGVAPYDPYKQAIPERLQPPSVPHWFGTDQLGRDVLSRVIYGGRISLPAALAVVVVAGIVGTIIGALAGFWGGIWDEVLMRVTDIFMAFPGIILSMAVAAALGPNISNAVVAIVVVLWPNYARIVRGLVLTVKENEYVLAGRAVGVKERRLLWRTILPNCLAPALVMATLDLGNAVLAFSGLSFLGLGPEPSTPEWGRMVSDGIAFFDQWWLSAFPGLAIFTIVMAFNFVGDGLRDALDPRLRRQI